MDDFVQAALSDSPGGRRTGGAPGGGRSRTVTAWLALALATLAFAGCLGEDDSPPDTLTVLFFGVPSLDPGAANTPLDFQYTLATQRTLYAVRPGSALARPDLAAAPPDVSSDSRTVTVRLRPGVHFSPPVRREVTAHDVRYAIERAFSAQVASRYAPYFAALVGADAFRRGRARHITGIEVADRRTLVFRLARPQAGIFTAALVLPITAPVPAEYARRFDAGRRSTYGSHVVATGPYMVPADARGRVTGYRPGVRLELVRNPTWARATDGRPAYLDRIVFRMGTPEDVALRQAISGSATAAEITGPPPPSIARVAQGPRRRQLITSRPGATAMIAFNTTREPFRDADVRRAVVAGFDRAGLLKLVGGSVTAQTASHFIPPGVSGFAEAGGASGPQLDFLRRPMGDLALATRYLRRAGYASGRYDGETRVALIVPGTQSGGRSSIGEYAQAQLRRLGFRVRLVVDKGAFLCSRAEAQACVFAYTRDFDDAQTVLQAGFRGHRGRTPNVNVSRLNDAAVNSAIDRAVRLTGRGARARAWARVDRLVSALAPAIPLAWPRLPTAFSTDVVPALNDFSSTLDLAFTRLRRP